MNKRQKEILQAQLDNEKAVLKKLESNYKDALGEINSKIELLMARQDADMQHVIYQVEYQKALKTQVQSILETLQANEFETISGYLAKAYEDGFIGTMYDLQGQGIPLIFPLDQKAVVAAIQNETKLSENLYTALGKDIVDLKKKITGEISRGLSSGQMFSEISRNIASWARIPKNNAMRITRTEAHRIQCKATADAQHKAKEKGADVVKQWDSTLDSKTRESHVAMDGEVAELDDTFSNGLEYPGDPKGSAEEVINCRCALLQRARWALGNDYTKWSEDAPIVYSDDGTAQLAIIEAKNYSEFAQKYTKAVENMEESGKIELTLTEEYEKNRKAIEKTFHEVESERRNLDYEVGTIVDRKGNIISVTGGEEHSVSPPGDLLKDNIFTHNHPSGGCFSVQDLESMIDTELLELRASTPQGTFFSLLRKEGTHLTDYEFAGKYYEVTNITVVMDAVERDIKAGVLTRKEMEAQGWQIYTKYQSKFAVEWLKENAEKYGYVFTEGSI